MPPGEARGTSRSREKLALMGKLNFLLPWPAVSQLFCFHLHLLLAYPSVRNEGEELHIMSPKCTEPLPKYTEPLPTTADAPAALGATSIDQFSMKVLGFSSNCSHSHALFFPLPGLILRRCTLDEEGIAYWEPPTYVKCVSIDYRNIQMLVRQTDFNT